MDKDRILAEVTPEVAAALRCLEAHGFASPWRDVAWHVAVRIGQSLRYSEGEAGVSPTIRQLLLERYGASPAVRALAATLPTMRRWSATMLAPYIAAYLDIDVSVQSLRLAIPPGDDPPD